MGLLDLDLKEAATSFINKAIDPFKKGLTVDEIRQANRRHDFKNGLEILEYSEGIPLNREKITLKGDAMPHVPFSFGGTQKLIKDYYPGNSEPTVQVLGPRESNITLKGVLKANRIKPPNTKQVGIQIGPLQFGGSDISADAKDENEQFRRWPEEMSQLIDAMRIRGNLIRITLGEFQRFGFIEETRFDMTNLARIGYEIDLSIIGFNPPSDCKVLSTARTIPVDINKNLINAIVALQGAPIPDTVPRSLSDQLNSAIAEIADAVNLATNFVDTVLDEVDDLKSAVQRGIGLVKYARNTILSFHRRIGAIGSFALADIGSSGVGGISSGYSNATYLKNTMSSTFSLTTLLASLQSQLEQIALTEPLARHKVQAGDTLQRLAVKFYNDVTLWKEIYDHNKLSSTVLEVGSILEIPRVK